MIYALIVKDLTKRREETLDFVQRNVERVFTMIPTRRTTKGRRSIIARVIMLERKLKKMRDELRKKDPVFKEYYDKAKS